MTKDNLVLDEVNPLSMFQPKDGCLGEALSGSVYHRMYADLVKDPSRQLLCPLGAYIDGTVLDALDHFTVEPFTFSPLILCHECHCCADVWKPFGYVQPLNYKVNSTE
jgi:hypothetical protein